MAEKLDISYKSLLSIALPLSLGAFVQFLVVLTDNIFLTEVGEDYLNGAGIASMLYITAIMFGIGLSSGTQIFIARRIGEGKPHEVGVWFGSGFRIATLIALMLYLVFLVLDVFVYQHIIASEGVLRIMKEFLSIRSLGLLIYLPVLVLNSVYIGTGKTGVLSISMIITAGLNILLDWLLIFGVGIFPEMKHEGAALATLIAEIAGASFMILFTIWKFRDDIYGLWKGVFSIGNGVGAKLMKLSAPLIIQQIVALSTWTTFFFFVEKVGGMELKVSNIVRNTYMLAFVAVMGVSYTTRTVISTLIAEMRQSELGLAMKRLVFINVAGIAILCHGLVLYPEAISSYFFVDQAGLEAMADSLRVVFVAMMIFSFSSILFNTLEGAGKTKVGMLIEFACVTAYIILVYHLTIRSPQPIHIIWMTDYLYFALIGIFSGVYLWKSNWRYHQI